MFNVGCKEAHQLLGELDGERDDLTREFGAEGAGGVSERVEVDLVRELQQLCRGCFVSFFTWSTGQTVVPCIIRPMFGTILARTVEVKSIRDPSGAKTKSAALSSYRASSGSVIAAWIRTGRSTSVIASMTAEQSASMFWSPASVLFREP